MELHARALQVYGAGKCDLEELSGALDEACDAAGRPSLGALREAALQKAPANARLDPQLCEEAVQILGGDWKSDPGNRFVAQASKKAKEAFVLAVAENLK